MFTIQYIFAAGLPAVILNFNSEKALRGYVQTWITEDVIYLKFTRDGVEYNPNWWVF